MREFRPVDQNDKLIYELMPILIGIGPEGNLLCYGTCFIASPHMAITARHVIDELLNQDPDVAKGKPCKFEYWIIQVVWDENQHEYVVWTIDSIAISPHSDIAIIWLKVHDQNAALYKQWKAPPISFDTPPIGSTIRAFGIHNVRFDGSRVNEDGKFEHIEVKTDRSISTGIVKEHYYNGRDKGLYNFPCFEVDAKFEHGMSGGLVINEKSEVCGIVCGSLPPLVEGEKHISYVTMLWPMMAITVQHERIPSGMETERYYVRDLSELGIFKPIGWERVQIEDGIDGSLTVRYLMEKLSASKAD